MYSSKAPVAISAELGVKSTPVKVGVWSLLSSTVTVTVMSSVLVPSDTRRTTTQVLASLLDPQAGDSKSGAVVKVSTPVLATIEKSPASTLFES